MAKKVIHSKELVKQLMDAGVVPDNCRRMILDVQYDNAVIVYFECFGDEKLLEIDFASHIGVIINERPATPYSDELLKQAQENEDNAPLLTDPIPKESEDKENG